jgi:hypothetical protein
MSNHDRESPPPSNLDADLARAWREASDEQPPSHLDAAIVAAARKSAAVQGDQPNAAPVRLQSRSWLLQWQPLAAAAGVVGLAFVLVQMLPRDGVDHGQRPSADRTVARPEPVVVPEAAPAQGAVPAPSNAPASPAMKAETTASETAAMTDNTAAAAEASADRRQAIESELAGRAASAAPAAAAPASAAREKNLGNAAPLDAETWTARILALYAAGDVRAAADALRAFRAADPAADTYLPESLREWARTVE